MKNKNEIFIVNNLLILSYIILKLTDFITTFQQLKYNNIIEANPFAVDLVQNPLLMYCLLFLFILLMFTINFLTYYRTGYDEIQKLFLLLIIFSNLIGIIVLLYNYDVYVNFG